MSAFLHFTEYWILAVLLVGALNMPWRMSWLMAVFAMVIASLYGISDELHQLFVPGRMCSVTDWLVDTAGATVGGLAGTWVLALYRIYSKSSKATDFQPSQIPDDQLGKNQPSEGQKIN